MIFIPRTSACGILVLLTAILFLISIPSAAAQTPRNRGASSRDEAPIFQEYRSVRIGMTTEEVRKKLNTPSDKGEDQDFFIFSDDETAQVFYDKSHKVFAISANFLPGARDILTPKVVLGSDLPAQPDGSIYKLVRYPKAGYWVSFSRTSGDSPLITVTLQRID